MILTRTNATSIVLGAIGIAAILSPALAQNYFVSERIQAASRCSDFGPGFIEMGNGVCARVGSANRVQLGSRTVNSGSWASDGTSSATLRSSEDMLPGAAVQHLRIPNTPTDSPFR